MKKYEFSEAFEDLRKTLASVQEYHSDNETIYSGELVAKTLGIAIPKKLDSKLVVHNDWGKLAVDTVANSMIFDAFVNDRLGFTRLISSAGLYPAINSAIKNSMKGGCSFIAILPRDIENGELPVYNVYSGAEATGAFDERTMKLKYGIAVSKKTALGTPSEYLVFTPGAIDKVSADGELLHHVDLPVNEVALIPYVWDQDMAVKPFGRTRFTHGCKSILKSELRLQKTIEFAAEYRYALQQLIVASGAPADLASTEMQSGLGKLAAWFMDGDGEFNIHQIVGASTTDLENMSAMNKANFAAAACISPTILGGQPSNGSFSEGTMKAQNKPYTDMLDYCKESYGESIKWTAILTMGLLTGIIEDDYFDIIPEWRHSPDTAGLASVADAMIKLGITSIEGSDIQSYVRRQLGEPLKPSVLNVPLAQFELSRKLAKAYAGLETSMFDDDGRLDVNNIPRG